jgi:proteasome alpha subunit
MYHVMYDGVVVDERRYSVLGGQAEQITDSLKDQYQDGLDLGAAIKLGARLLGTADAALAADQLEVALLDRSRPRRAFRRIRNGELEDLLAG